MGYHIGTAVGGALLPYLTTAGAAGTQWCSFHHSRALHDGAAFGYGTPQRPDIVTFAFNPVPGTLYEFVVWENKGHCGSAGVAPLAAALAQAQSIVNMTVLPGGLAFPAPIPPNAHLASQVDTLGGFFRVQVADPSRPPRPPISMGSQGADTFLRAYYSPFIEALQRRSVPRTYHGRAFQTIDLPQSVRLGVDAEIVRAFPSKGLSAAVARATGSGYPNTTPHTLYVDPTGISVELPIGWTPRNNE
jgi:hypothetical protein